jgi:DNA-binding MarR family transcriptional regulator
VVQALERKKLVARSTPARDLRAHQVALTAKGRAAAYEIINRFAAAHQAFFEPLLNEQNAQLVGFMKRLIQANDFHL